MHRPFFSKSPAAREEAGSVIVVSCFIIAVLLVVIGLAVDSGNLYRAQIALQKSADAAAMSTMTYVVSQGPTKMDAAAGVTQSMSAPTKKNTINAFLTSRARQIALANMAAQGLPETATNPITVTPAYDTVDATPSLATKQNVLTYTVTVKRPINYLLMDFLPKWAGGTSQTNSTLQASSTVRRKEVWSVVLLDASRSMACPATGSCTCLGLSRTGNCPTTDRKYDRLLDGAKAYLETFDLSHDHILFVPFHVKAQAFTSDEGLLLAQQLGFTGQGPDALIDLIRTVLPPQSMTNICDALQEGNSRITQFLNSAPYPSNERIEYVLFSDGAPTAGRFLFSDVKPGSTLPHWPPSTSTYDYTFNNIAYVDPANNVAVGPSLLAQNGAFPFDSPDSFFVRPPDPLSPSDPAEYTGCPGSPTSIVPVAPGDTAGKQAAANAVFGSCLNSLQSHLPNHPEQKYGGNYKNSATYPSFADFAELPYMCAIQLGDAIRNGPFGTARGRGRISVIGVGDAAPATTNPFQNAEQGETRHDVFLSRLALDETQFKDVGVYKAAGLPTPEFNYEGYQTFATMKTLPFYEQVTGEYYPQPNVGDLRNVFQKIAQKVALRYIN